MNNNFNILSAKKQNKKNNKDFKKKSKRKNKIKNKIKFKKFYLNLMKIRKIKLKKCCIII